MWPFTRLIPGKKKLKFSREASFSARPVRNPAIVWDPKSESDELVLTIPRRSSKGTNLAAWVLGVPKERRLQLDEIGSFVWRQCDGSATVQEVIRALMNEYKLSQREATVSLTTYLQTLGKRGLIAFAVEKSFVGGETKDETAEEGAPSAEKNTPVRKRKARARPRRRVHK